MFLLCLSSKIFLDFEKLKQDAKSAEIIEKVQKDIEYAHSKGVQGTPSIEIDGILYLGIPAYDELVQNDILLEE